MTRFPALTVITWILAIIASPCHAFEFEFPWFDIPVSFRISLNSFFEYHDDNFNGFEDDDKYFDLKNRLSLKLNAKRFSFSGRFDTNTFFNPPAPNRPQYNSYYIDRYAPEKLTAKYIGRDLKVTFGDFYATIGRGLALSIRKTDQLGEDNTLLGGRISWNKDWLQLSVLSGLTNPSNLDLYEKTYPDPYDWISAISARFEAADRLWIGTHAVAILFDPFDRNEKAKQPKLVPSYTSIIGASVESSGIADVLDLYFEANWLGRQHRTTQNQSFDLQNGWGAYGSAILYLGNWTLTAEGKSLNDFYAYTVTWEQGGKYKSQRIDYLLPPTLEPKTMEVANNWDISGARLQIDYRPGALDTLLFASYSGFWAEDFNDAGQRWIYNLNTGIEHDFWDTGRAKLTVGLREEVPQYSNSNTYHLLYSNLEIKLPLSQRHSLDIHGTTWFVRESLSGYPLDFAKGECILGYSWSPWLAASIVMGWDTFPSRGKEHYDFGVFYSQGPGEPLERQLFLAGTVTFDLWGEYQLRLTGGQMRGGVLCVNGVCRTLPPFAGARAELRLRF